METATVAAGCFWGIDVAFRKVNGATSATLGYTGGWHEDLSYEDVCSGRAGHTEAVQVEFDTSQFWYHDPLELFWQIHEPRTLNRRGPDVGTQYRSKIFFHDPEQEAAARASRKNLERSGAFGRNIVTEITPASTLSRSEDYHQQYFDTRCRKRCLSGQFPRTESE